MTHGSVTVNVPKETGSTTIGDAMSITVEIAVKSNTLIPLVAQIKIGGENKLTFLFIDFLKIFRSIDGNDKLGFQSNISTGHFKRIGACTRSRIHTLLFKSDDVCRAGSELLQPASCIGGHRDNHLFPLLRILIADGDGSSVVIFNIHF